MGRNSTVIIPTHNYGKWLPNAIASILFQTQLPQRIVVIDDNSTDDTLKEMSSLVDGITVQSRLDIPNSPFNYTSFILDKYKAGVEFEGQVELSYIRLQSKNGQGFGPSYARNVGINLFWDQTDIFYNLDADDEFHIDKIKEFDKIFDNESIGVVYADYITVDEAGTVVRNFKEPYSLERLHRECIVHSGAAFAKKALELKGMKKGGAVYDNYMRTCEDWDLWLRLSSKTLFHHIPKSLTMVRVGSHNSTATVPSEVWQQNWRLISERLRSGYYQ